MRVLLIAENEDDAYLIGERLMDKHEAAFWYVTID